QSPDQFAAIDADHASIRETFAESGYCSFIARIGKRGNEHTRVCDIKIRVTRRESQYFAHNLLRHRKREDVEFAAMDFHLELASEVLLERLVIFVGAIFFNDSDDSSLRYKAGEIIDVTIGVVAGDAVTEPQNFGDAEIIAQTLLDFISRKIGIS